MKSRSRFVTDRHGRGAAAVQALMLTVVLLGFSALTIDVGNLYGVKAELQNAADAAALAGASAFADSELVFADGNSESSTAVEYAHFRAYQYAMTNSANGRKVGLEQKDIVVGRWDSAKPLAPVDPLQKPNAVQVTTRFSKDSFNGPVQNFFASVMGYNTTDVGAIAVAAFADGLASYTPQEDGYGNLIPFTIHKGYFDEQLISGPDEFSYDEDLDIVQSFNDGTGEFVLYPEKQWAGSNDGAGNFGTLNIGIDNLGTANLGDQILAGVSPEELQAETGDSELTFHTEADEPQTYEISGNTGLSGGMEQYVEQRVGDVVGFLLHSEVNEPGANAVYTIVSIRFARVMAVQLNGNPNDKRIVLQPVVHTDDGVVTDPNADGTDGLVGRIVLVR